jgi:hypothetical protein
MAKSRETPAKCLRCAPLAPAEARAKHPNCWDDKLCTARRFYINNRAASAVGIEVWDGHNKLAVVSPVHCAGWLPSQVHEYLRQALTVLDTEYGFKKFASQVLINPEQCPVRPCFLCQR